MTFGDVKRIRENPTADDVDNRELHKLIDIAIEEQTPKKVELTEDCCICPNCRFDMMGVYDFTDSDTKDPTYCPNCGQALEWGDTE